MAYEYRAGFEFNSGAYRGEGVHYGPVEPLRAVMSRLSQNRNSPHTVRVWVERREVAPWVEFDPAGAES